MRMPARIAWCLLGVVFAASLLAGIIAPNSYGDQFREAAGAAPSGRFWLGTDDLGRDRFSRLLYGSQVSLLLAPAAALLSTLLAAMIGGAAGYLGGRWDRALTNATDLFVSLPWLFLLLAVRALLPLNVAPRASVGITFLLLGCLGWGPAARIVRAATSELRDSAFLLQARMCGIGRGRLLWRHLGPNLKPVLLAQFLVSIPAFIIAEANLGLLGLGVSEPLPSWGAMLRELENYSEALRNPWMLAPMAVLVTVLGCFQIVLRSEARAG